MGSLLEEFVDGVFSGWKRGVDSKRSVHLMSLDLHLYCCDDKLGSAGKLKVDFLSNALGLTASCCGLLACCNRCLEGNDPVVLIFDVGLGELDQIYLKQELI